MKGKVAVITGGTSGVGRAAAIELARQGASLLLVGRHRGRAADTEREIREIARGVAVRTFIADLSSLAQVRRVAGEILDYTGRIDVLFNNAGAFQPSRKTTADGFETTFATNHLAYYLLTRLLLDRIRQSSPARVINTASETHRSCSLDFDDLQNERRYRMAATYGKSKLANLMFTYELARRLDGSGVTANAFHPGWTATRMGLDDGLLSSLVRGVSRLLARTPKRGAETAVWLASSPEMEGITGKYFLDCREHKSNAASHDEEAQRRLWDVSARMVGLEP
jgi:retinol dehydrogenase-14